MSFDPKYTARRRYSLKMAFAANKVSTWAAFLILAMAGGLLPACTEAIERSCPMTGILGEAATTNSYRPGAEPGPNSLIARGQILSVSGDCDYSEDEVQVDLDVEIEAARGPGDMTGGAALDYFVAIIDPAQAVVAKRNFTLNIDFPEGVRAGIITEELRQTIPVADAFTSAAGYRILVGFEPEG